MTFAHFAPSALIWAANSSGLFPTGSKPSACVRSCTSGNHDVPRYACRRGALDNGEPRCIEFGGLRVDDAIEEELLRVLEPAAIDAALEADSEETRHRDEVLEALKRGPRSRPLRGRQGVPPIRRHRPCQSFGGGGIGIALEPSRPCYGKFHRSFHQRPGGLLSGNLRKSRNL